MPNITIIGAAAQPQNEFRLLNWLESNLRNEEYTNFIIEAAFAKQNPFIKLNEALTIWKNAGKHVTAYIGIDHKGTSIQALQHSLRYFNQVYITHARYSTFHPKTYLFYGSNYAVFYSGSNNFTSGGLETNFESGLIVELNLLDSGDKVFLDNLLENYSILNAKINCCIQLDENVLSQLQSDNYLLDETKQNETITKTKTQETNIGEIPSIDTIFGNYRALPPRALPKQKKSQQQHKAANKKVITTDGTLKIAANGAVGANGLVIQIKQMQDKHNGEIMLSKSAVDQNHAFFGYPFSGKTTPKLAKNEPSEQREPDPIVNIQVIDAAGKLIKSAINYGLNTIYYTTKSELRITISVSIMSTIPSHTILVMTRATDNSYDYDLVFYHPGSMLYNEYLKVCNQIMPSGGANAPRKFGWI